MKTMREKLSTYRPYVLFLLLILALPAVGLGCKRDVQPKAVTLNYWRVFDGADSMKGIIEAYNRQHPFVRINYKKLRLEEYEKKFVEALAEDRGPDLFSVHNTWIGKYEPKIYPLPKTTTVAQKIVTGTLKKEVSFEERTTKSLTVNDIENTFIDTVAKDVVRRDGKGNQQILGIPLAVDTLVMYYNRDMLNQVGLVSVPTTWQGFLEAVATITRLNDAGGIVLSGAALGTAENIPRYADIVSVLMMQNGAEMTDRNNFATFHQIPSTFRDRSYNPGLEALRFYTDFANPTKEAYSWNENMPNALEAFAQGRTAFFFGYSYHRDELKAKAPHIRWEAAPIPQTDPEHNEVNFANYWVETVSQKAKHKAIAWHFLQFAANQKNVQSYLNKTTKPTALRSLVNKQKEDVVLAPYASQLLTAKSWYRGKDVGLAEAAMGDMIAAMRDENANLKNVIATSIKRINQSIR